MSSLEMKKLYLRHCTLYFIILSARLSVCTLCPRRSYPIYIGSCYIRRVTTSWAYSILYLSVLLSIYFQFVVFKYIHVCVSVLNCHSNSLLCTVCPCLNKVQQKTILAGFHVEDWERYVECRYHLTIHRARVT